MFDHVEPIDIYWTSMILIGIYPGVTNVIASIREYRTLATHKINHGAQLVSLGYMVTSTLILVILIACLTLGILSMSLPPTRDPTTPTERAIVLTFFAIGFMIVMFSWVIYVIRYRYHDYIELDKENDV